MKKPIIIPSKTNNKNMERYLHKKLSEAGEGGGSSEAIKFTEQTLTTEQKAQARANIGAASNSTVEQLNEEISGYNTSSWVEATPIDEQNNLCIAVEDNTNRVGLKAAKGYNIAKYEIPENTTIRFSAAKPVPPSGCNRTVYAIRVSVDDIYGSNVPIGTTDAEEGSLIEQEFNVTIASYITVCGNSTVPPKLEVLQEVHNEGLEERVADLENEVEKTENKVQSLEGNESNETKYPSTKAVYDGIHPTIITTQPQNGFVPNIFYNLGELTGNITFTLATPSDATIVNHYYWTFETGSTAPTVTWPNGITWLGGSAPEISASKHYEISVLNGIGAFMEV